MQGQLGLTVGPTRTATGPAGSLRRSLPIETALNDKDVVASEKNQGRENADDS